VALDSLDLRPLLPSIRTPVLLIGGDRDRIVPWGRELVLLNHLPDVRRIELHQCGHYPQYTHPRATAAAIGEFLEGRETRAAWSDPGRAPLELSL
jgi:pimeloyl-ACP methyl ester carboxylesterase